MFLALYLVVCLCLLILWKLRNQRIGKSYYEVTPPELSRKLPIIGNALRFFGDQLHAINALESIASECTQKGGVVTLMIGSRLAYVITDPDDCLTVSNKCLEKDQYYDFAKPFLGDGLLLAKVPRWKKHRRILNSAFSIQCLNGFMNTFNSHARALTRQFAKHTDKGYFDQEPYLKLNNLKSICMTAYGVNIENIDFYHKFLDASSEIMDIFAERFSKIWLHPQFIYNMTGLKKRQDRAASKIKEFSYFVLQKRKAQMLAMSESKNANESKVASDFKPFMDSILEISKDIKGGLTDDDIIFETNNIVGGGSDTSAITLTTTLTLLGAHPDIQEKAYDEIRQVLGDSDRDICKDDLPKLLYLEAVLKETLRIHPVAPIIARYVDKDVQLKSFTMKAGNSCFLLLSGVLKHPVWGPDVTQFKPERWLMDSHSTLPKHHTFAGFSVGRRGCIGKSYALMSMKTTLAHLLRHFRVSADDTQLTFKVDVVARPHSGHFISLERRL